MTIKVIDDFSKTPGARYRSEGDYSGEEFREELLEPKFIDSKNNHEKLIIDLDGGYGYSTSFLEEAFGGLARKYDPNEVDSIIDLISQDEPSLIEEIKGYILNARKGRQQ